MSIMKFASFYLHACKDAEPINNNSDYCRIKKWKNKATTMYISFSIISVVIVIAIFLISTLFSSDEQFLKVLAYPVVQCVTLLTMWGFATIFLNFKLFIKSVFNAGKDGYAIGEQVQTTHVNVRHEYGNQYSVKTNTEHQGCVVAFISGFINLFVWAFLSVYICPFLMFKKIVETNKNLQKFENA